MKQVTRCTFGLVNVATYDIASKGVTSPVWLSYSAGLQRTTIYSSLQCLLLDVVIDVTPEHVRRAAAKWRASHDLSLAYWHCNNVDV
jgi:hypothetical protein